jgi:hypothetical protein
MKLTAFMKMLLKIISLTRYPETSIKKNLLPVTQPTILEIGCSSGYMIRKIQ